MCCRCWTLIQCLDRRIPNASSWEFHGSTRLSAGWIGGSHQLIWDVFLEWNYIHIPISTADVYIIQVYIISLTSPKSCEQSFDGPADMESNRGKYISGVSQNAGSCKENALLLKAGNLESFSGTLLWTMNYHELSWTIKGNSNIPQTLNDLFMIWKSWIIFTFLGYLGYVFQGICSIFFQSMPSKKTNLQPPLWPSSGDFFSQLGFEAWLLCWLCTNS